MTNPTPLSPAAQAVLDATSGTFGNYQFGARRQMLAAALRAAAFKLSEEVDLPKVDGMKYAGLWHSHDYLNAIAAELDEGAPMTPDFRALCAELVDNIHRGSSGMLGWTSEQEDELLARARAALSEPGPEAPAPFVIRRDTLDD